VELKFLHGTNINFIAKRYIFFVISVILALAGAISLVVRGGPNYGIDFAGGILLQISADQNVNMDQIRSALDAGGLPGLELQSSQGGGKNSVIIRAKKSDLNQDQFSAKTMDILKQKFPQAQFSIERVEYVGPAVGQHLVSQAFMALIFSFLGIIIYVAFRFHSGIWGTAGVIGIMHDVFVIFGIFSLLNKEITLTIVAALLTIAGYSINDTIVVFDRIRENLRLAPKDDFGVVINRSVNQTLSRTIITSFTVFMVALALFFLGGEVIHDFAFALLIGVFVGTYSSIYVCSPLVFEWEVYKKKRFERMRGSVQKKGK
jgi:preprotein translocase subunit SecF